MISRLEFLFPSQIPDPSSPQYQQMIAEIGKEGRWSELVFLLVAVLCLIPVILFGSRAVWQLIRQGSVSAEVFIGVVFLVLGTVAFFVSRNLEEPRRPYRLAASEYANYRVVEARITRLGVVWTQRPGYIKSRKIHWESAAPLARQGWSPSILVSGGFFSNPVLKNREVRVNDVAYVGLDPSDRLPPLFLGLKQAAR